MPSSLSSAILRQNQETYSLTATVYIEQLNTTVARIMLSTSTGPFLCTDLYMTLSMRSMAVVEAPQAKCPSEISSVDVIVLELLPLFRSNHLSNPADSCKRSQ